MSGLNDPKQISLEFPSLGVTLRADLLWEMNPQLCDLLVRNLPETTIISHTMASGKGTYAPMRAVGNIESKYESVRDVRVGNVSFNIENYKALALKYGEMSEPIPARPVAQVVADDLDNLAKVGREIWFSTYVTHEPIVMHVEVA